MKKLFFAFALILVGLTACSEWVDTSRNGKLDGLWQMTHVDTLATGGIFETTANRVYYAVQGNMLQMNATANGERYIFRFSLNDNKLKIYDARINDREAGDVPVTNVDRLRPYGMSKLEELFVVEQLTSQRMILRSETLRLTFRKY